MYPAASGLLLRFSELMLSADSYVESKHLARVAARYILARGAIDSVFNAYFKTNSATTIRARFTGVEAEAFPTRT